MSMPRPPRVRRVSPRNAAAPRTCAATIAKRSTPGRPRTKPGTSQASCPAPTCVAATATVTGRSRVTWLTINPVPLGRVPTDEIGLPRAGAGDAGTCVDAGAIAAEASGEGAGMGRGADVDARGGVVAIGSDAEGRGELVTVGSDPEGNGDPVAIGSEAEGSGRRVEIGDAEGRGGSVTLGSSDGGASVGSTGRVGPAAAADLPRSMNAPATTSAATSTTGAGARSAP
jgi:hypothetical protein